MLNAAKNKRINAKVFNRLLLRTETREELTKIFRGRKKSISNEDQRYSMALSYHLTTILITIGLPGKWIFSLLLVSVAHVYINIVQGLARPTPSSHNHTIITIIHITQFSLVHFIFIRDFSKLPTTTQRTASRWRFFSSIPFTIFHIFTFIFFSFASNRFFQTIIIIRGLTERGRERVVGSATRYTHFFPFTLERPCSSHRPATTTRTSHPMHELTNTIVDSCCLVKIVSFLFMKSKCEREGETENGRVCRENEIVV